MLADVPQFRTYINAYDSKPQTMEALVDKLICGEDSFKGVDPIDSFCGLRRSYVEFADILPSNAFKNI